MHLMTSAPYHTRLPSGFLDLCLLIYLYEALSPTNMIKLQSMGV